MPWPAMMAEAYRSGKRIAIPLVGDDKDARAAVAGSVRDCRFEPVGAGRLAHACLFDPGQRADNHSMPAEPMRQALGLG